VSERRKWILGIIAAFVFGVAGGVVGALGVVAFVHGQHGPPPFMAGGPGFERGRPAGPGEHRMRGRGMGRPPIEQILERHLDLSDEQRAAVERILDEARPRYAAMRESTHAGIDRVLTPDQRTKLKQIEDRFPARRREEPDAP